MRSRLAGRLGLVMIATAMIAGGCATTFDIDVRSDLDAPSSNGIAAAVVEAGQCFTEEELGFLDGVPVACTASHSAEFFAVMLRAEPRGAPWPGLERLQREASGFCNREFERTTGVAGEIAALDIMFLRPDETSWGEGDREISCFVRYDGPITEALVELDPTRAFGLVSTFAVAEGDCIAAESLVADVAVPHVDCAEPHRFEVFASVTIPDGVFPGDDAVRAFAAATCDAAFGTFVGVPRESSRFSVERLFPTAETWNAWGDRLVSCALTDDAERSGSARGSGL